MLPMMVLSVNVGSVRSVVWQGREATTAIWKFPVEGRLPVRGVNIAGDNQADRRVRVPCWKLGARMNDAEFPRRFAEASRPGAYLRVLQEGDIGTGDGVRITHRPAHGITVGDVLHVYLKDRANVGLLLRAPELGQAWRAWAQGESTAGGKDPPG